MLGRQTGFIVLTSAPASFETCHLNCPYQHLGNSTPTFNRHSAIGFPNVTKLMTACPPAHKLSKWLMRNNKSSLPSLM